jgi:phage FluMu protein Com
MVAAGLSIPLKCWHSQALITASEQRRNRMAQSIKCTHCGAVMKTANPIAPGKKVKCPKCAQPFVVQAEEEERKPVAEEEAAAEQDETGDGDLDFGDKPKTKKASKKAADDDDADDGKKKKPAKKGKGMLIGLLIGGALLLCCCCSGGGGTGYWFWSQATPAFVGNWESKIREPDGSAEITLMVIENGKGVYIRSKNAPQDFKWKATGTQTVEFDLDDPTKKKTFWTGNSRPNFTYSVDGPTLTLVTTTDKRTSVFNKIADKDGKK